MTKCQLWSTRGTSFQTEYQGHDMLAGTMMGVQPREGCLSVGLRARLVG